MPGVRPALALQKSEEPLAGQNLHRNRFAGPVAAGAARFGQNQRALVCDILDPRNRGTADLTLGRIDDEGQPLMPADFTLAGGEGERA